MQFIICEITEFDTNIQVTLLYWFTTVTLRHSISRVQLIDTQIKSRSSSADKTKFKRCIKQLANQHFSIWLDATILLKMYLRTKVNYCSGARHKERGHEQSYMFW